MVSPEPQLVDADGMVVELAEQRSLLVAEAKLGRVADGWLVGCGVDLADQRAKFLEDVVDRLDQAGAVTDQAVAAAAGQAVPRPGTAKTSRFCSMAWCAVDSDPLRGAASTTTTPRQRPEMIRLRCENQSTWLSAQTGDLASSGPPRRVRHVQPPNADQSLTLGVFLEVRRSEVARRTSSRACFAGCWSPDGELTPARLGANELQTVALPCRRIRSLSGDQRSSVWP